MKTIVVVIFSFGLAGCYGDETVSGYADPNTVWELVSLDNEPFRASATVSFPKQGRITGNAPCNTYFADQTAPYPWFEAKAIGSTRRACPESSEEFEYLNALGEMSLAEVTADTLILSNDAGRELVFRPQP